MLPINNFPYTDYHSLNLDFLMKLARESMGLHLEIQGNELALVNANHENVSKVRIAFADVAGKDEEGNNITSYIIDAGKNGRAIVFTTGAGDTKTIQFPDDAINDVNGQAITSYVKRLGVAGNKLLVTFGDSSTFSFTCPYANAAGKAEQDENGKVLTTYMADVEVSGNNVVFKDGEGVTLKTITVSYAENAGVAEKAAKDPNGNAFLSNYAYQLSIDGNKIGIDAHDGTTLNKITVPFSTLATNATNAIQTVAVSGDQVIFTTYGGTQTAITSPFSVKAQKDDINNVIKHVYVANVTNNSVTGEITFWAADGSEIVTIVPTVDKATHDSYNNVIADYIKTIAVSASSNYVTVTTGKGVSTQLQINYSDHAFRDLNHQPIHNTYITYMECVEDVEDGHYKLVCYNGDIPKAELFRFEVTAYSAQTDINGRELITYVGGVVVDDSDSTLIDVLDGENNVINKISGSVTVTPAGSVSASFTGDSMSLSGSYTPAGSVSGTAVTLTSGTLPSMTYDSTTETLTFSTGSYPTVDTVTDPSFSGTQDTISLSGTPTGLVSASFIGTASTEDVTFKEE